VWLYQIIRAQASHPECFQVLSYFYTLKLHNHITVKNFKLIVIHMKYRMEVSQIFSGTLSWSRSIQCLGQFAGSLRMAYPYVQDREWIWRTLWFPSWSSWQLKLTLRSRTWSGTSQGCYTHLMKQLQQIMALSMIWLGMYYFLLVLTTSLPDMPPQLKQPYTYDGMFIHKGGVKGIPMVKQNATFQELFTLLHLFLPDSYWTPGILLDWTRTGTNFMLADHHTNFVSQS